MKIYAKELLGGLKKVKRTKVHSVPVLNHVLLTVEGHKTVLRTTDLETPLQAECESFTDDSFSVCVPMVNVVEDRYSNKKSTHKYYPLFDLIKIHAETNDLLNLQYIPETCMLIITTRRSKSTIKCKDSSEFPIL